MRILERHIVLEVLANFAMALLVISGIFFLGSAFRALQDEIGFAQILRIAPYLVPYTLPYTVPISLLMATALAFGRMASDNEITALRASGVSMVAIILPAAALGAIFSGIDFYLEGTLIPYCHEKKKDIEESYVQEILDGETRRISFPSMDFFCTHRDGDRFDGLIVEDRRNQPDIYRYVAARGSVRLEPAKRLLLIRLENVAVTYEGPKKGHHRTLCSTVQIPYPLPQREGRLEFANNAGLENALREWTARLEEVERQPANAPNRLLAQNQARWMIQTALRELHARYVMALAPLLFVLIGATLPVILGHDNRLVPFFVGFLVVLLFFFVPYLGLQGLAKNGRIDPSLLWTVDALLGVVGLFLLSKAVRGAV